jgi:non-heme chloroperoxidase
MRDSFWLQGMQGGLKGQYDCIRQFFVVAYTPDQQKVEVPTLVIHGDADPIVPIDAAGRLSAKIVKNATIKVYTRAPHGLTATHHDPVNNDLLAFIRN